MTQTTPRRGFEAWLERRKAATATDDELYEQYLDAATGAAAQRMAGVVTSGQTGMGALDLSGVDPPDDDSVYAGDLGELDGSIARKRAEEAARQHVREREEEALRNAKHYGLPLGRDHEHLRPQLRHLGY